MKLSQKIKHIKRHRKNKNLKNKAETIQWLAITNIERHNSDRLFLVSPLMYEIIRYYHTVPDNLKCSDFVDDVTEFIMTVPSDIIEFYNNQLDYLKEWLHKQPDEETVNQLNNIPLGQFVNPELYMHHISKPIPPKVTTLNGVRV